MGFEWDPTKAELNFRTHRVRFAEALPVFSDDYALTITDDESDPNEPRFITVGFGSKGRLLVVAYTYRGNNIRVISARAAEPHEREEYDAQL
ncbi:MAG TPA: BrnT family toxin [Bryobacteraceae bacterium]|jgi:uncharacterized DUF497 family protein|nr:BrnT family toxin [Bryobacteraceae bacterium]